MMMMRFPLAVFFLLMFRLVLGQEEVNVRFDSHNHYAGARDHDEKSVEFTYMFTNTGSIPVQVSGVNPCSRCELIAMSRSFVKPGSRGFVSVRYQLPPQPGRFMESFQLFLNNELSKPVKLGFSGELLAPAKDKAQIYAYCFNDLCFKDHLQDLGRVKHTTHSFKDFSVFNAGKVPLDLTGPPFHPFLHAELYPAPLLPGEKGMLKVTYRASGKEAYGPQIDTLRLISRTEDIPPIDVPLKTHIEEDFSKLKPDQLTIAPQLSFIETRNDIGAIKRGEEVKCKFEVKNKGRRQLIIRSLFSPSPMVQIEMSNRVLRLGQIGEVIVTFTAAAPKGQFLETITIICNDPKRPEANLYIQGVIIE